jgi:hypothetical protein
MDSRTLAESIARPPARVVILRDGPDGHEQDHADAGYSGADLEPASALDLLDRLLAGELFAVGRSIRVDVRAPGPEVTGPADECPKWWMLDSASSSAEGREVL